MKTPSPPVRYFLLACGWFFLALAALGVFLPLLPTTPFVLLTAFCFARGSQRLHARLLRSRLFGPLLRDWQESGAISLRTRWTAAIMLTGLVGYQAIWGAWPLWLRGLLPIIAGGVLLFIFTRPTAPRRPSALKPSAAKRSQPGSGELSEYTIPSTPGRK